MKTKSSSDPIYCRLCLSETQNIQNYINVTTSTNQIQDKITKLFHFTMTEAEYSPYVCQICRERVESTVDFMDTVLKNQETLKKRRGLINFKVKEESEMEEEYLDPIDDNKDFQMDFKDLKEEDPIIRSTSTTTKKKPRNKQESVNEQFTCDICSKTYRFKALLAGHIKKHMAEPLLECDICFRRFQSEVGLASHKKQGHDYAVDISNFLLCDMCERRPKFETFTDMTDHYMREHGVRGYVKCCSKIFYTKRSVVYHSQVHSRPTDFMCNECKRIFPNKYSLRNHMIRHKPEEEKEYACQICPKRFHLEYDLKTHIRHVHDRHLIQETFSCEECNKTFASKVSLYLHNRRFHMNLAQLICETCGKECRSKADLRSHIKARHTDIPKTKCDICGNLVKNMKKHKQIHEEASLDIRCEICNHSTTTFKYLRLHMKIHNDEKPYVCSTCGQSFKRKKALDDHMSVHSGIPRHFCNYCDRTFNNSGNKFKHIKQVHPEEAEKNRRQRNFRMKKEVPELNQSVELVEPVVIQYQVDLGGDPGLAK